jgi:hypothetical protein
VWLVPGGIPPDRQPDGNSVIFAAPAGLIVVDTGRHSSQREAILALARAQKKEIVAIVNTHWHLDHVSGNPDLRAAYPGLRVYASDAIDGALENFFPLSARDSAAYLDDPQIPQETRDDIRGDLLTIQNGAALRRDEVIPASGTMTLGGRPLAVKLARDAATAGDVWLYIPGHGGPVTRAQFQLYQTAFGAYIECSNSERTKDECAKGWTDSIGALLADDPLEQQRAHGMAAYYVDMLRANGERSKFCAAAR